MFDIFINSLYEEIDRTLTLISQGHKRGEIYKSAGCLQTGELSWKNSVKFMKDT